MSKIWPGHYEEDGGNGSACEFDLFPRHECRPESRPYLDSTVSNVALLDYYRDASKRTVAQTSQISQVQQNHNSLKKKQSY